jgi:hypothetical protein
VQPSVAPQQPATSSAPAAPAQPSEQAPSEAASEAASEPPPQGGAEARTVDLTTPGNGVLASDAFRAQGFLASADPGTTAVPGCEGATAVAVVTDPDGKKFLTSSSPDDPAKCHVVPVFIDFLRESPAGAVALSPLTRGTLEMEVGYANLTRTIEPTLTVPADQARERGGVDFLLVRPRSADGAATAPVALTALSLTPLR